MEQTKYVTTAERWIKPISRSIFNKHNSIAINLRKQSKDEHCALIMTMGNDGFNQLPIMDFKIVESGLATVYKSRLKRTKRIG